MRALQQVEQRQPRERRQLGVRVVRRCRRRATARACAAWPLAYSSAAFSSTAQRPGLACGDLDRGRLRGRPVEQARAGDRDVARRLAARAGRRRATSGARPPGPRPRAPRPGARRRTGASRSWPRPASWRAAWRTAPWSRAAGLGSGSGSRRKADYRPAQPRGDKPTRRGRRPAARRSAGAAARRLPDTRRSAGAIRPAPGSRRRSPSSAACRSPRRRSRGGGSGSRGSTRAPRRRS